MKRINKQFEIEIKEAKKEYVEVRVSTDEVDRMGDVVEQDWILPKTIPVILFHDGHSLPVGKIDSKDVLVLDEGGRKATYVKVKFASEIYEDARIVEDLVRGGFLDKVSIGFIPNEVKEDENIPGQRFARNELVELSFVIVPANASAEVVNNEAKSRIKTFLKACGIDGCVDKAVNDFSYYKNKPVDLETPWDGRVAVRQLRKWASSDGSGDKDKIDWNKYRYGFAWYDAKNKEMFGSYKLPFCYIKEGKLTISKRGTITAMAVVLGAMGGVDVSEPERKRIYNFLTRIYKEKLELDPPEFKSITDVKEFLEMFNDELKFYKNLAEDRKKMLKLYRKMLKQLRQELNLPKVENEEKAIVQIFSVLKTLYNNIKEEKSKSETRKNSEIRIKINPKSELGKLLAKYSEPVNSKK